MSTTFQLKTGHSAMITKLLKHKVKNFTPREKLCSLLMDEMSIKKSLRYDPSTDSIGGFEDFGSKGSNKVATHALVFMVKGMTSNWKQPFSYYLSEVYTC